MLTTGTTLGTYEIIELLGKGGMGEVYRAHDSKLKRDVALKIIPQEFSLDEDRTIRFAREAEVLASLNHPNIAVIYDLQEANGCRFLVLELVEGETLADRIAQGPLPVHEALLIAKQIAEALEAAHEKGIVHRDLKPANVKILPDGKIKVLDFGLAKAIDTPAGSVVSDSPTLSVAATNAGIILGTAAYMSPEQAKGGAADRRADIWSFGVVLYEFLTGKQLFDEPTVSETLAAVLKGDLKLDALPATTPVAVLNLVHRCLTRDVRRRLRDIGEARITIEEAIAHPEAGAPTTDSSRIALPAQPRRRRMLPWVVAASAFVIAAVAVWFPWRAVPKPAPVMRLSTELGVDAGLSTDQGPSVLLSPDSKTMAFVATRPGGRPQIYVRRIDQLDATPLAATEGARDLFFSPDGLWIAFFAGSKLNKISVTGGPVVLLCDVPNDKGGAWTEDGSIIFSPDPGTPLFRVSAAGGKPEQFTKLDSASAEVTHRWPQILPGGRALLYTASASRGNHEDANIIAESLPNHERKIVHRGGYHARYLPSGHLVFIHQGTLFAAPFDLERLEVTVPPVPVIAGVASAPSNGGAHFDFSQTGSLVYLPGGNTAPIVPIFWMQQDGKTRPLSAMPFNSTNFRFSPDGTRLAMEYSAQKYDIWVYEWARDTLSRLTFEPGPIGNPVWTPDGRRISFGSARSGIRNIYWQRTDGTGEPQRLTESKNAQFPMSWHPSGKFFAFDEIQPKTGRDIFILPMEGDETSGWKPGKPTVFLATPFIEENAAFSPDGKWLAYDSNESGRFEIYIRPFPGPGGKWQISTGGGEYPTWSRNGRELFYRTDEQKIMVSTYTAQGDYFRADKPLLWSEGQFTDRGNLVRNFDLHPDGKRFAVQKAAELQSEAKADKVVLILNFFDELRRIAPMGRN